MHAIIIVYDFSIDGFQVSSHDIFGSLCVRCTSFGHFWSCGKSRSLLSSLFRAKMELLIFMGLKWF